MVTYFFQDWSTGMMANRILLTSFQMLLFNWSQNSTEIAWMERMQFLWILLNFWTPVTYFNIWELSCEAGHIPIFGNKVLMSHYMEKYKELGKKYQLVYLLPICRYLLETLIFYSIFSFTGARNLWLVCHDCVMVPQVFLNSFWTCMKFMRLSANPILEVRGIFLDMTNTIKIMEERFIVDNQVQEYK